MTESPLKFPFVLPSTARIATPPNAVVVCVTGWFKATFDAAAAAASASASRQRTQLPRPLRRCGLRGRRLRLLQRRRWATRLAWSCNGSSTAAEASATASPAGVSAAAPLSVPHAEAARTSPNRQESPDRLRVGKEMLHAHGSLAFAAEADVR